MNELVIAAASIAVVSIFLRMCPKSKILAWLQKPCYGVGVIISKFLTVRIGKKAAERVEESIISTLLECLGQAPLYINRGLLADNKKKVRKEKAKRVEKIVKKVTKKTYKRKRRVSK